MELYPAKEFLKYVLFSSNRKGHGIHSPFVFNLIVDVFRNKNVPPVVLDIERTRKRLSADDRVITVRDLGAGSKRMKGNLRKVSDIAKYSSVTPKYGRLLANMATHFGGDAILELGTSFGISTMYLAAGHKDGIVYTIEGCRETLKVACENFESNGFKRIGTMNGSFDEMLPEFRQKKITPGLIYIDGDHKKDSVLRYYEQVKEISGRDTVIIFDDIHTSAGMVDAWETIKSDRKISLTIDIHRFGMVFFRKGMTRMDYEIRY